MIARNLHDENFASFIKKLRIELPQKFEEGKRDWELVRDAIELWEQLHPRADWRDINDMLRRLLDQNFVNAMRSKYTELMALHQTSPVLVSDLEVTSSE